MAVVITAIVSAIAQQKESSMAVKRYIVKLSLCLVAARHMESKLT